MSKRIGVYPGTFDPLTNGHVDIIARSLRVVDHLIVGVATNDGKTPMFDIDERVAMLESEIAMLGKTVSTIEIMAFDTLLVDFVREAGAGIIVRGLRAVSDFEYEFQMAGMNARLAADIETVFLMASDRHQFISSRFVKEIGRLGGDISPFVPKGVLAKLQAKFKERSGA